MSNTKCWERKDSERKESKSIYLTAGDWEFLNKESKGAPSSLIREMIIERRNKKEKCD